MSLLVLPYPILDPVLLQLGPITIRWYALAYIGGLVLGWVYVQWLLKQARFWLFSSPPEYDLDSLVTYLTLGIILGGRLGYVIFYNAHFYLENPKEILAVWKGGMSFHGGLLGALCAIFLFCRRYSCSLLTVLDLCSAAAPIGLFFGRLANFINGELWGRPAPHLPFAVIFPDADFWPRHPSQLYEAATEGLFLFIVLIFMISRYGFRNPGLITGVFSFCYGIARIGCEFFREPDPQLGFIWSHLTMGMILSLPLVFLGIGLIACALGQCGKPLQNCKS
jgi:phosphatidylglycerol:prolipoprotein diacylglycerol transferase